MRSIQLSAIHMEMLKELAKKSRTKPEKVIEVMIESEYSKRK